MFYFEPASGLIVALEMYPAENDIDPCEIYFSSYREHEGRYVPRRIRGPLWRRLFGVFMIFELANWELQKSGEK